MDATSNVKQAVPFFWVGNMERSLRFYLDGLGFEMTLKWTPEGRVRWCRLKLGGAAVMLQEYQEGKQPAGELGTGVSVCFMCDDALSIYREVKARGIEAEEPFVGNGLWAIGIQDPDGYRLSFESPTGIPEETKLSEVQF